MMSISQSLKQAFSIAKRYFLQKKFPWKAWLLLGLGLISIFSCVASTFLFSMAISLLWDAVIAKNITLILGALVWIGVFGSAFIISNVSRDYLKETLALDWRQWLTKEYIQRYVTEKKYLYMGRFKKPLSSPAQRIQTDVRHFVDLSVSLGFDFSTAIIRIALFSAALWIIGGALTVAVFGVHLVIPGYLFWCAVLFAGVGNYVTHKIGKKLVAINKNNMEYEADFRKEIEFVQQESENIAQARSEVWHKNKLDNKNDKLFQNRKEKIKVQTKLSSFLNTYLNFGMFTPLLAAAPLYFKDKITVSQFSQIFTAFSEISLGFSWFSTSYDDLSTYFSSTERLHELEKTFNTIDQASGHQNIKIKTLLPSSSEPIQLRKLKATTPESSDTTILSDINLSLKPGEHTLLKGESGLGKSTLFKVLSGTWTHGEGEATLPIAAHSFFLTQKPLLPRGTLREVLAYPHASHLYSEEAYKKALTAVRLEQLIPSLDVEAAWSKRLSGGEQQRVAFARASLMKPKWLFMDEATSALDDNNERNLYQFFKTQLKETTLVSIAHKPSVDAYHDKILTIDKDKTGRTYLRDTMEAQNSFEETEANFRKR